jgi:hypothetical protein
VIVCPEATFNTNEELGNDPEAEAKNTTANAATLVTHPNYGGAPLTTPCKGTLVAGTFQVEVKTKFCNFKTKAAKPGEKTGEVAIICEKLAMIGEVATASNIVKGLSSTAKLQANFTVTGGGIPAETTVTKVNSATEVELSNLATVTAKEALTFKSPGIENVFLGLTGCTVTVFSQTLKGLEYKNEPKPGTAEQEVTTAVEVAQINSKATGGCALGIGEAGFKAEYRKGKIKAGPPETAEIEPVGNPALTVAHAVVPGTTTPIASEVGINEAHFYENHIPGPRLSGGPKEEGTDLIGWGKLELQTTVLGTIICQNEFGGDVFNPEGAGPPPGGGMAKAGEGKLDAFQAYDCTGTECEATLKSKQFIEAEDLGIKVNGVTKEAEFGEWEGGLETLSGVDRLRIGNKTPGSEKAIHFRIFCPNTGIAEQNTKAEGELAPEAENGTAEGSAPSKVVFNATAGELTIGGKTEGKVFGKVKTMGYEGGSLLTVVHP